MIILLFPVKVNRLQWGERGGRGRTGHDKGVYAIPPRIEGGTPPDGASDSTAQRSLKQMRAESERLSAIANGFTPAPERSTLYRGRRSQDASRLAEAALASLRFPLCTSDDGLPGTGPKRMPAEVRADLAHTHVPVWVRAR
jgi:hypothetical protein